MTRLNGLISVCVASGLGAAMAAAGCSSSSNPVTAENEAGTTGPTDGAASPDGAVTSVVLQWKVVGGGGGDDGGVTDGGPGDSGVTDGGPGDSGAGDSAVSDGAVADSALAVSDASDGAATEAGVAEAGAGDAEAGAEDAATVLATGGDAGDAGNAISLGDLPPVSGVQVCIYQNSSFPCVTTQADGTFTMPGLPIRADVVLSFTKSGFLSYLLPIETASIDMDGRSNPIFMDRAPGYLPPGLTYDMTKGEISAFAVSIGGADGGSFVGVQGTKIALSPMSGSGPYFSDQNGLPAPSATSFVGNSASYFNVDPGSYTLTYANSGYDCEPISFPFGQFGIPVTTPAHSLKITVGAGYVTGIVGVLCTVNPVIVAVDGG
jgi:hypothetical protein